MEFFESLDKEQTKKFKQWRILIFASTWLTYAGFYFCRQPFFVVKKAIGDSLSLDPVTLSNLGTAYLIAYAVGQFVNGWLGKKIGSRLLVLSGLLLTIVSNLVFGFSNSFWTFCLFMVVNGLAQSSGWPGTVGNLAYWFHRKERGTVLGFWSTCYQLGGVAAKAFAAYLLGKWGWHASFFGGTVVVMLVWIFVVIFQRNKPEDVGLPGLIEKEEGDAKSQSLKQGGGWTREVITTIFILGMVYFFIKFLRYAFWSWSPYFLCDTFGMKGSNAGYLSTLFDLGGFLGVLFAGFLSDRLFKGRRNQIALLMAFGMMAGCFFLWHFGAKSVFLFTLGTFVIGFMLYGPDSLASCTGAIDVGSTKGAVMAAGIINGMGSLGPILQEKVIGYLLKGSMAQCGKADLQGIFFILMAAAVMATLLLALLYYRAKKGKSKF